ncbi:Ubiquitin receptor RAD23c [Camellia lanceoleosa]|uniref:Ubiquitin receptor RAD23c n=1 Tax=Camellia lanceoleosa TaxID=1840588 RepID=A0ACC0FDP9_9ERIC|nr:Ubiquitin receptor RAD23c [Camellia lanceoleosa]
MHGSATTLRWMINMRLHLHLLLLLPLQLLPCQSLMSMVKQHRIWLLEVTLMERSSKFLIWVEGLGIGILLFELFVLLTTQRELLHIHRLGNYYVIKLQGFIYRILNWEHEGIPEQAEVPPASGLATNSLAQPAQPAPVPSTGPNANPLDLFLLGLPNMGSNAAGAGTLDFLRNSQQICACKGLKAIMPSLFY